MTQGLRIQRNQGICQRRAKWDKQDQNVGTRHKRTSHSAINTQKVTKVILVVSKNHNTEERKLENRKSNIQDRKKLHTVQIKEERQRGHGRTKPNKRKEDWEMLKL